MLLKRAPRAGAGPAGKILRLVQLRLRSCDHKRTSAPHVCWCGGRYLTIVIIAAVAVGAGLFGGALPAGFIPGGRSGPVRRQRHAAARRIPRTHGQCFVPGRADPGQDRGVDSFSTIGGYGVVTSTYQPNFGTIFVRMKPWDDRHSDALHVRGIMANAAAAGGEDFRSDHLSFQHSDDLRLWRIGRF